MPVVVSSPVSTRVVSAPIVSTRPLSYRYGYGYGYPYYPSATYAYASPYYSYNPYSYTNGPVSLSGQPTFYGTCAALGGRVLTDNCLGGTTAVSTGGDGCVCYDRSTFWSGCGNTANGVCLGPSGSVIVNPIY